MNEPLQKGDRVELITMSQDPNPIPNGTKGVVTKANNVQGEMIYEMQWDNGRSLSLIGSVDIWKKLQQ